VYLYPENQIGRIVMSKDKNWPWQYWALFGAFLAVISGIINISNLVKFTGWLIEGAVKSLVTGSLITIIIWLIFGGKKR
jgi:hypothetical protein